MAIKSEGTTRTNKGKRLDVEKAKLRPPDRLQEAMDMYNAAEYAKKDPYRDMLNAFKKQGCYREITKDIDFNKQVKRDKY